MHGAAIGHTEVVLDTVFQNSRFFGSFVVMISSSAAGARRSTSRQMRRPAKATVACCGPCGDSPALLGPSRHFGAARDTLIGEALHAFGSQQRTLVRISRHAVGYCGTPSLVDVSDDSDRACRRQLAYNIDTVDTDGKDRHRPRRARPGRRQTRPEAASSHALVSRLPAPRAALYAPRSTTTRSRAS